MKRFCTITGMLAALLLAGTGTRSASAAETGAARDTHEVKGPNRALLRSGVWTLGIGYVPAAAVAIGSSLPEDDRLYIPVAGPWMNYAARDCEDCTNEGLNKALLVTDGVVQGLGALQIVGSFLLLETRPETPTAASARDGKRRVASSSIRIAPAKLGSAYGIAATTRF